MCGTNTMTIPHNNSREQDIENAWAMHDIVYRPNAEPAVPATSPVSDEGQSLSTDETVEYTRDETPEKEGDPMFFLITAAYV